MGFFVELEMNFVSELLIKLYLLRCEIIHYWNSFPLCNNQKDDMLNSNIQKLRYDHIEFEKIDLNHHIHIT